MNGNAYFFHHRAAEAYKFNEEHPFDPVRLMLSMDLLKEVGALKDEEIREPDVEASDELLALAHRTDYIQAVKQLDNEADPRSKSVLSEQFGLQDGDDTPFFPGLHGAASSIVSGTVSAAEAVMSGKVQHAYHMAGGLHHAFPDRAAGFCVYNDAAIAIAYIRHHYKAKVLYIDTDVHHGDGVQWCFYDDPEVCTYSIHETGKFLFPGTGYVYEKGTDKGFGCCVNLPLEPYTEDESWLECFEGSLRKVVASFRPDVILSQHGCDAHAFDPLSHIHCSMNIYSRIPALIHQLAHDHCQGRWIAVGGGGYDHWRVVPRAWSIVWLEMTDHKLAHEIANHKKLRLPGGWLKRWRTRSPFPLPRYWLDEKKDIPAIPRREQITEANRSMLAIAIQDL
jgi:acetoin utilization protein AcuC